MLKYLLNLLILLLPSLAMGGLLVYAGDMTTGLKLGFLSLLGVWFWVLGSLKNRNRYFKIIALIWWGMFTVHSAALATTWLLYNSNMDAYFVIQSVANTTSNESFEFVQQNALFLAVLGFSGSMFWLGEYFLMKKYLNIQNFIQKKIYWIIPIILTLLSLTAWVIIPIRAVSPPIFWVNFEEQIDKFKQQLAQHKTWHQKWFQAAKNTQKLANFPENQTIILIISESLTSNNVQACGYPRPTMPNIMANLSQLTIFCDVYSGYPNTLGAVTSILTDVPAMRPKAVPTQSVLADAKAAGFKLFWLSNQDDAYLASLFGSLADVAVYNNKRSGRSSFAKDGELLPHVQAALRDAAVRKLIIVHLIGSHPNYSARYPNEFAHFPTQNSTIENQIKKQLDSIDASFWIRHLRNEYDNSVLYQDYIFNQIFQLLKNDKANYRGLIFLSDHGNEVGHVKNFAGHSPTTEAGFKIPIIMWDSANHLPTGVFRQPIDATQLDANLLHLMGLRHNGNKSAPLWTDKAYSFTIPNYWRQ